VTGRSLHAAIDLKPWRSRRYLTSFLKAPLGWVLVALLLGAVYAEANVREQNRMACGAVFMMLDRQQFQGIISNASRAQTRVIDACEGLETTDTFQRRAATDGANAFID
jgi:hypothetical protein